MLERLPNWLVVVGKIVAFVLLGVFFTVSYIIFVPNDPISAREIVHPYLYWPVFLVWVGIGLYAVGRFAWWFLDVFRR